jgi:hypothetical protein
MTCDGKNDAKVEKDEYGRLNYIQEFPTDFAAKIRVGVRQPLSGDISYTEWGDWKSDFKKEEESVDISDLISDKIVNLIHEVNQTVLKTSDITQRMGLLDVVADAADMLRRYLDNFESRDNEEEE